MSIKIILKNSIVSFRNNESNIRASRKIELLEIDVVFFFFQHFVHVDFVKLDN